MSKIYSLYIKGCFTGKIPFIPKITNLLTFIGNLGGTLGMFIGFSFANLIICVIDYIQYQLERKLISRNKCTETIWKCLKWIIYFSLMATAIIFAKDIIEKFFGQNTGIKQNMEKIESHPTITICPFLHSPYEGNYISLIYV